MRMHQQHANIVSHCETMIEQRVPQLVTLLFGQKQLLPGSIIPPQTPVMAMDAGEAEVPTMNTPPPTTTTDSHVLHNEASYSQSKFTGQIQRIEKEVGRFNEDTFRAWRQKVPYPDQYTGHTAKSTVYQC